MIKSFKHKGLKKLFETGKTQGVNPKHIERLRKILALLESSETEDDMDLPGLNLHNLKGARKNFPRITFEQQNICELNQTLLADFVSACEVLEHLADPKKGLDNLHMVCRKVAILSVPNEPLFRTLNFLAGKYWRDFGNSPGHLNHWNSSQFVTFVSQRFNIVRVCRPLPWTVLIARPKTK